MYIIYLARVVVVIVFLLYPYLPLFLYFSQVCYIYSFYIEYLVTLLKIVVKCNFVNLLPNYCIYPKYWRTVFRTELFQIFGTFHDFFLGLKYAGFHSHVMTCRGISDFIFALIQIFHRNLSLILITCSKILTDPLVHKT